MKQIAPSTGAYLLEAPLEFLHRESIEFLDEIEFWKDETAFLYTLIGNAIKKNLISMKSTEAKNIERKLIRVSSLTLDELGDEAKLHEKFLAKNMGNVKSEEPLYRSRHRSLATKFHDFEKEYKEMKRSIFKLVEELSPAIIN